MPDLFPPIDRLGLSAPVLGPWFGDPGISLPRPTARLSVLLPVQGATDWLPPTTGLLGLFVATDPRPPGLRLLRDARGDPAFSGGSLVALFRIWPEVEDRLDRMIATELLPADGIAVDPEGGARIRVRHLALELEGPAVLDPDAWDVEPTPAGATELERAETLGLTIVDGRLANGVEPMGDLKRPGRFQPDPFATGPGETQVVLSLKSGAAGRSKSLWAFDLRGRAVDPGAVAAWWRLLAGAFNDTIWAEGLVGQERRTVGAADGRLVQLVHPNETGIDPTNGDGGLLGRIAFQNLEALDGAEGLRRQSASGQPAGITVQPGETPVRTALLPSGSYGTEASIWPPGANLPARDHVRVGIVDLDRHLVGGEPATAATRRVRPRPLQTDADVLLDTAEAGAAALLDTLDGDGERRFVTGVLDRDWGSLAGIDLPAAGSADFPPGLEITVRGLVGGGEAAGGTIEAQRVLLETEVGAALTGAWVRAWPLRLDPTAGRRFRLDGGAAPVRVNGNATVVMTLPPGAPSGAAPLGVDVMVIARDLSRFYPNLRFQRPATEPGDPQALSQASGPFLICESGLEVVDEAGLRDPGRVPSGATVVSLGDPPTLIDRDSLEEAHLDEATVVGRLTGLRLGLTEPPFRRMPRGSDSSVLQAAGAVVDAVARSGLDRILEPGAPLPGQERLEVAAVGVEGNDVRAAVGTAPTLARHHELLPHQLGHMGAPAAPELHGTAVELTGPAAVPVLEYLRDRTARPLNDLVAAARQGLPDPPVPPGTARWTAFLRTVAPGVEGEPVLLPLILQLGDAFTFGGVLDAMTDWLSRNFPGGLPPALDGSIEDAEALARALDRRMTVAARGAREALESLIPAIDRAAEFIYIETPAVDLVAGEDSPWRRVSRRLEEDEAVHVLLCTPVDLLTGTPQRLQDVRAELLRRAVPDHPRVRMITPSVGPGRSLRLASTTVIVDDAYALTGSSHLWRRGMSFDSSVAVAVFDEELDRGRPRRIRGLRRSLVAGRLGVPLAQLPDEPPELFAALDALVKRDGGARLTTEKQRPASIPITDAHVDAWNRDGALPEDAAVADFLTGLLQLDAAVAADFEGDVSG